jgi:hypothetical protein
MSGTCLHCAQLTEPAGEESNGWHAAAWTGVTRGFDGAWSAASAMPWCQGEPNNKNGNERCCSLVTNCASGTAAMASDVACERRLRVLCAYTDASCGRQARVRSVHR